MPASSTVGTILLGAVAARTVEIEIRCRVCSRYGKLRTDRLIDEHGPDMPLPDLLRILAGDCPGLTSSMVNERCDAHCPTLSQVFGP